MSDNKISLQTKSNVLFFQYFKFRDLEQGTYLTVCFMKILQAIWHEILNNNMLYILSIWNINCSVCLVSCHITLYFWFTKFSINIWGFILDLKCNQNKWNMSYVWPNMTHDIFIYIIREQASNPWFSCHIPKIICVITSPVQGLNLKPLVFNQHSAIELTGRGFTCNITSKPECALTNKYILLTHHNDTVIITSRNHSKRYSRYLTLQAWLITDSMHTNQCLQGLSCHTCLLTSYKLGSWNTIALDHIITQIPCKIQTHCLKCKLECRYLVPSRRISLEWSWLT